MKIFGVGRLCAILFWGSGLRSPDTLLRGQRPVGSNRRCKLNAFRKKNSLAWRRSLSR